MKKIIIFSMAVLALSLASCSKSEDKISPKNDAHDMAKAFVGIIDKAEIKDQAGLDSLKQRLDSMEATFYEFYEKNKLDEKGQSPIDSLKIYFNEERNLVDSAFEAKTKKIIKIDPKAECATKQECASKQEGETKQEPAAKK